MSFQIPFHSSLRFSLDNELACVEFNTPDSPVNPLTPDIHDPIMKFLDEVESNEAIKGLCVFSTKENYFIAGGDLRHMQSIHSVAEAHAFGGAAQSIFNRIARLKKPGIALINGACVGTGLEFVLACTYRIASASAPTIFSFPEIGLGIIPGGGGTQRLPRLIGLVNALKMLMLGIRISASDAYYWGLVDILLDPENFLCDAKETAHKIVTEGPGSLLTMRRRAFEMKNRAVNAFPQRKVLLGTCRRLFAGSAGADFSAPLKLLDVIDYGFAKGIDEGLKRELDYYAELLSQPLAHKLVDLFLFNQELRKSVKERKDLETIENNPAVRIQLGGLVENIPPPVLKKVAARLHPVGWLMDERKEPH